MLKEYQAAVSKLIKNDYKGWRVEGEEVVVEYENGLIRLQEGFDQIYLIHAFSVAGYTSSH